MTALAVSVDNLVVGFAMGPSPVGFALAAVVIGAVSVVLSLAGLELGGLVGIRIGRGGDVLGGVVLIGVGAAVGAGLL